MAESAQLATTSFSVPPKGCGTTTILALGTPKLLAAERVNSSKFSVVKTTAGTPAFSISIKSWTLHEVQDPQSADPVKTN